MSTAPRVFVGRLAGLAVFDPLGDQVGRVRDVVVMFSATRPQPRVIGLVVEVPGRRRVFVPMTRVTSIDAGAVITTGLVNMRRFEQRTNEVRGDHHLGRIEAVDQGACRNRDQQPRQGRCDSDQRDGRWGWVDRHCE